MSYSNLTVRKTVKLVGVDCGEGPPVPNLTQTYTAHRR